MTKFLIFIVLTSFVISWIPPFPGKPGQKSSTEPECEKDYSNFSSVSYLSPNDFFRINPECVALWNTFTIKITSSSTQKKYSVYILSDTEYELFKNNGNKVMNRNNTNEVRIIGEYMTEDFPKTTWYNEIVPNNPNIIIRNDASIDIHIKYSINFDIGIGFHIFFFTIVFVPLGLILLFGFLFTICALALRKSVDKIEK